MPVKISVEANDKVCFYAEKSEQGDRQGYLDCQKIDCTAECYVYGNIMSLLTLEPGLADASRWNKDADTVPAKAFQYLFWQNQKIKNHNSKALYLPAINLGESCYRSMFESCKELTSTPVLPALVLQPYCYYGMFKNVQT